MSRGKRNSSGLTPKRTKRRFIIAAAALGITALMGATIVSTLTATNVIEASSAGSGSGTISADTLKPSECSGINLTELINGSGTYTGTGGNTLVLGSTGQPTITGGAADDCLVAGADTTTINGGGGTNICIGSATTTFQNCGPDPGPGIIRRP